MAELEQKQVGKKGKKKGPQKNVHQDRFNPDG